MIVYGLDSRGQRVQLPVHIVQALTILASLGLNNAYSYLLHHAGL